MGKLSKSTAKTIPALTEAQTNMAEAPSATKKETQQRIQRSIRLYQDMWENLEKVGEKLGGVSVNATVAMACKCLIDDKLN